MCRTLVELPSTLSTMAPTSSARAPFHFKVEAAQQRSHVHSRIQAIRSALQRKSGLFLVNPAGLRVCRRCVSGSSRRYAHAHCGRTISRHITLSNVCKMVLGLSLGSKMSARSCKESLVGWCRSSMRACLRQTLHWVRNRSRDISLVSKPLSSSHSFFACRC